MNPYITGMVDTDQGYISLPEYVEQNDFRLREVFKFYKKN